MNRCPHCGNRLPRQLHYLPPSYGRESVVGVILITAGYGAVSYMLIHLGWPWTRMLFWPVPRYPEEVPRLIVGAAMWGVWLALLGVAVTTFWWFEERKQAHDDEPRRPRYDQDVQLGDDLRLVTREDGYRHFLREQGFVVPAEPQRGALSRWLWAVHEEQVTFSQRGARTVVADTPRVRTWASEVLALWCLAGWAQPVNGWNGDAPDLGNGVDEVDEAMVHECASGGQTRMIERLLLLVDASVEPPHSDDENDDPT